MYCRLQSIAYILRATGPEGIWALACFQEWKRRREAGGRLDVGMGRLTRVPAALSLGTLLETLYNLHVRNLDAGNLDVGSLDVGPILFENSSPVRVHELLDLRRVSQDEANFTQETLIL